MKRYCFSVLLLSVCASASFGQPFTISKTDGGTPANAGSGLTYTITVHNTGTTTESVRINEKVPSNSAYGTRGSSVGWSCPDGSLERTSCDFDLIDVAPGETRTVRFSVSFNNPMDSGLQGSSRCR